MKADKPPHTTTNIPIIISTSFHISAVSGCKSNKLFTHGIYTTPKANPNAHNKAQINRLLLNIHSPY